MAKSQVVALPRPEWSPWYFSEPFIITRAGTYLDVSLTFKTSGPFDIQSTIQVQLEYYHNGQKKREEMLGTGGTLNITLGDDNEEIIQHIKLRIQGNSLLQYVDVLGAYEFKPEFELQLKYGKSPEERLREEEIRGYREKIEKFKGRHNLSGRQPDVSREIVSEDVSVADAKFPLPNRGGIAHIFSGIANIFMGSGKGAYTSIIPQKNIGSTSNLRIEKLLGAEISRAADSIVDRIVGRHPNLFQASAGRFLSQSVERFGKALADNRISGFEDAFAAVLGGKNGARGFVANIGNQVVGGLLQSGLGKIFGGRKTTMTTYESSRSLQAVRDFRMSRGQEAAEMLTQIQTGSRNL